MQEMRENHCWYLKGFEPRYRNYFKIDVECHTFELAF